MEKHNFLESSAIKKLVFGLFALAAILGVFRVGEMVGSRKAAFSYRWGENYYRNFAGPQARMMDPDGRDFLSAHGVVGKIIQIASSSLILADRDNLDRTVLLSPETDIFRFREKISLEGLKIGDGIAVIGSPDEVSGEITAKLIRILPPISSIPGALPIQIVK